MTSEPCYKCDKRPRMKDFSWCKSCRQEYDKEWYQKNKDKRRRQNKEHRRKLRLELQEIKKNTPCADCGQKYHPVVMDWDHRPNTSKVGNISDLVRMGKTLQVKEEIKKCDVVCANCHRLRTFGIKQ